MIFKLIRSLLLYLSQASWAKWLAYNLPFTKYLHQRFIAGQDIPQAIAAIKRLNKEGFLITVDRLGEFIETPEEAERAGQEHIALIRKLGEHSLSSRISVKLSQFGLLFSSELATTILTRLLEEAQMHGIFIRIDMEDLPQRDTTVEIYRRLRPHFSNLGIVLQAYLRDTHNDVQKVQALGGSVRLCKGAYQVDEKFAFQETQAIHENYLKLANDLFLDQAYHGFATHDESLLEDLKNTAQQLGVLANDFEFQMLYGVRPDLQKKLKEQGYRVRIYLPYGKDWYSYYLRRIAERPQNLLFVVRAFWGGLFH